MTFPRSLRSVRELLLHKTLIIRYVVLPSTTILFLWTVAHMYSFEYGDYTHPQQIPHLDDTIPPSPTYPVVVHAIASPVIDDAIAPASSTPKALAYPPAYPPPPWHEAAEAVKQAFLHAYSGYERFAAPHDELRPSSNLSIDNFNGWGVTIYDSLDTMLLMNLTEVFDRAMVTVSQATFSLPLNKYAPFFETTIRYLGGLLSAHALSGNPILLDKADDLARALSPIFDTKSGLPAFEVNTVSGKVPWRHDGALAEIASFQPEFTYLAKATGKKEHYEKVDRVMKVLQQADNNEFGGMLPTGWTLMSGKPHNLGVKLNIGGQGDSGHEYLIKQYLLTGKTDKATLELYLRTTTHIITHLLYLSPNRHMLYATSTTGPPPLDSPSHVFEHLACFLPGMFALGVQTLPLDDLESVGINFRTLGAGLSPNGQDEYTLLSNYNLSEVHRWAAEGLAESCAVLYAEQPSGLGPEEAMMAGKPVKWVEELERWRMGWRVGQPPGVSKLELVPSSLGPEQRDYFVRRAEYELRPETIESLFLLWKMTGHERWREYGWNIFRAIERETKTAAGYSAVYRVEASPAMHKDSMPSYFMAETLKYLYLLFTDKDLLPLDKWVFNTEAHPLPVFNWTAAERAHFGI
ncbi:seven-hairpin glycosidase [Artomyces pyxidatus]|uniref:Seven-hairpin glycosidase n=1 Tax=Artomyces pyxidatus TaxID=48021 RepID=A0ACB8SW22_9AGAM|nr:seven-hairpin glycosidase [Artomyces pyxidatus]